ncbi:biotin transporter BioY [Paraclostridium bifermentans]|uniref:biotin transporter BioY n=1 Tax=Paraclostridium bifermentans TaxID=1490 RepID=UPI0018A0C382|nr:biotin transporter BioY [Paraclostridium bifermentans]
MKRKTLDIVYCGIFATITAILSQIAIPLPGGVPLTLQTFAVSLVGILLGSKKGFISILVYILMGAIGLPVFSGFSAGIGAIVGPTGGFILSFPIMSFIIGLVCERTDNKILIFLGMILASIPNYLAGAFQFSLVTGSSFYNAFLVSVLPFILLGIIKAALATIIGSILRNNKSIKGVISYDKA